MQIERWDQSTRQEGGLDLAGKGGSGMSVGGDFDKKRRGRRAVRVHSNRPAVVGQGMDNGRSEKKKPGRVQERDQREATRAGGVLKCWMGLKQAGPLSDLWGGASLEGRELPWTRKEREGKGMKKKKERGEREKAIFWC